ncbi:MAG: ATP-dependent Clp protease proteolytic subunit [Proteobacteria bacterium]|nr:ATP-dependent Clp protease proteolytic subunit [Pseudomonadota bacterium]
MKHFVWLVPFLISSCILMSRDIDYDVLTHKLDETRLASFQVDRDSSFFKKGIITLQGEINNYKARIINEQLLLLDSMEGIPKITILLNSHGGDSASAFFIINTLSSIEKKVDVICVGYCFSAACAVLQSATGKRLTFKETVFLIHGPVGENASEEFKRITARNYTEIITKNTRLPGSWFPLDENDHFFSVEDAVKYDFVDDVVSDYLPN